jgi:hypothetical protein
MRDQLKNCSKKPARKGLANQPWGCPDLFNSGLKPNKTERGKQLNYELMTAKFTFMKNQEGQIYFALWPTIPKSYGF